MLRTVMARSKNTTPAIDESPVKKPYEPNTFVKVNEQGQIVAVNTEDSRLPLPEAAVGENLGNWIYNFATEVFEYVPPAPPAEPVQPES